MTFTLDLFQCLNRQMVSSDYVDPYVRAVADKFQCLNRQMVSSDDCKSGDW